MGNSPHAPAVGDDGVPYRIHPSQGGWVASLFGGEYWVQRLLIGRCCGVVRGEIGGFGESLVERSSDKSLRLVLLFEARYGDLPTHLQTSPPATTTKPSKPIGPNASPPSPTPK